MNDSFLNSISPDNRLWELIGTAFPESEAAWQRDFLVTVSGVLRRIDYIFFHVRFGLFVIEMRSYFQNEIVDVDDNTWILLEHSDPEQFENLDSYKIQSGRDFTIVPNPYLQA